GTSYAVWQDSRSDDTGRDAELGADDPKRLAGAVPEEHGLFLERAGVPVVRLAVGLACHVDLLRPLRRNSRCPRKRQLLGRDALWHVVQDRERRPAEDALLAGV